MVFLPWVSAAKALDELGHLERWVMKQANLTSPALSALLEDEEVTRKATLQNQAAIDFLCLAHGHGCEDFEGICCFNLSSKSETIHTSIQQMRKLIGNIKTETEDWLDNIFKGWGLTGWVSSVVKTILWGLFVVFLIPLGFRILKKILTKSFKKVVSSTTETTVVAVVEEGPWWEKTTTQV